jgi:hypothetical protein
MPRHLTTPRNEIEADIILSRLREAGISGWESNSLGGPQGSAGPRDIYVDDADVERAREVLRAAQDVDEGELEELAEDESAPGPG